MLGFVAKNIKNAIAKNCTLFMIYYSGHGVKSNGAWQVNLEKVTLELEASYVTLHEIFKVIDEAEYNGEVEITSDSCYAGKLCYEAKQWWEENKRNGNDNSKIK